MKTFQFRNYPNRENGHAGAIKNLWFFRLFVALFALIFGLCLIAAVTGCSQQNSSTANSQREPQPLSVDVGESKPILFFPVFSDASELNGYNFYYKDKDGSFVELDKFNSMKDVSNAIEKAHKAINSSSGLQNLQPLYYKNEEAAKPLNCFGILSLSYNKVVSTSTENGSGLTLTDSFKSKYLVNGIKLAMQESSWGWNQASDIQVDSVGAFTVTSYNKNSPLLYGVKFSDTANGNGICESYKSTLDSYLRFPVGSCLKTTKDTNKVAFYYDFAGTSQKMKELGVASGWDPVMAGSESQLFLLVKEFGVNSSQSDNSSGSNSESSDDNQSSQVSFPAGSYSRKGGSTLQQIKIDSSGNAEYSEYDTLKGDKLTETYKMEFVSKSGTSTVYKFNLVSGSSGSNSFTLTYNETTKELTDDAALPYVYVS